MINEPGVFGWLVAAAMIVMAIGMVVATLVYFGSHLLGLTLICLVGAGCIWGWLQDQRDQRR
tara:strand:- start:61 stop:246 length:186 start_codon:yes stop_codon:yes gene_type:complete